MKKEGKVEGNTAGELASLLPGREAGVLEETAQLSEREVRLALEFVRTQERDNPIQEYHFEISGDPPVSQRPRHASFVTTGASGERQVRTRTYAPDGEDQLTLAQLMRLQLPQGFVLLEGEVELYFVVYRPVPASFPAYKRALAELGYIRPAVKPDYDNFAKILTDAMRHRVVLDDGQAVHGQVTKLYSRRPRLEVLVAGRRQKMIK